MRGAGQQSGVGCGSVFGWSGRVRSAQMETRRTGALDQKTEGVQDVADGRQMAEVDGEQLIDDVCPRTWDRAERACTMHDNGGRWIWRGVGHRYESTQNVRALRLAT